MVLLQKKLTFPRIQEGPTFSRGGGGGGGVQMLISMETHITCDFPGGSRPTMPPSGYAHGLIVGKLYLITCVNYPFYFHGYAIMGYCVQYFCYCQGNRIFRIKIWGYLPVH